MRIPFYKYQGTGNDFVIIDSRKCHLEELTTARIVKLCGRRLGIGADGLILLRYHAGYDFEVVYYNADGSQSFCGNGSRCAVHLAHQLGMVGEEANFLAIDGSHKAFVKGDFVEVAVRDVTKVERLGEAYWLDTGSPHYVVWVDDLDRMDVFQEGKKIRFSAPFRKQGVNVNFVQKSSAGSLSMRTYERGVEQETLSCGSGATAVALAASLEGAESPVVMHAPGGCLQVRFEKKGEQHFQNIYLTGPVEQVYQGVFTL